MPADTHERLTVPTRARPVAPNDDTDLALDGVYPRGFILGQGGDVSVLGVDDAAPVTLPGMAAGITHTFAAKRIRSTGTTASNIIAVY